MNVLILNSSPRKAGNIAQMVAVMADEARLRGAEVSVIEVSRLHVSACVGCMHCRSAHACALPADDAQRVLAMIGQADALVIAAPCYWGNIPGTLKLLFDRMVYGLMGISAKGLPMPLHKGKRCVLVATSTTPWPLNILLHQSHGAVRALREICHMSGFRVVATVEKGGTRNNTALTAREERRCRRAVSKLF